MKCLLASVLTAAIALAVPGSVASAVDVTVNGDQRYQTIEGFGTCLVNWIPSRTEYYRSEEAQRMYAEELGMNMLRISFTDGSKPTEDWRDISYKNFEYPNPDTDLVVFTDFAKAIKKINPDIKFIASCWSPPAWMKVNQSTTDERSGALTINMATEYRGRRGEIFNRVKPEYYQHYAKWLVEMVKYHEAQGIPIYAVSPANEPQFTQDFGSCVWNGQDYATIVGLLGEQLEAEGLGHVKIFGPEGMTNRNAPGAFNPVYIEELKKNETAWKHHDIFATHGYVDGFVEDQSANSSAEFRELIKDYDRPFWITEGGTGMHEWPIPLVDGVGPAIHNALVAGHVSAFVPWQFASGDVANHHALMPMAGPTKKTYVFRQFSRYIPAGAVRVDATPEFGTVSSSAYVHEDKDVVTIVLFNTSEEDQSATVKLSGEGVADAEEFNVIRTSAEEDGKTLDPIQVEEGTATVELPAMSIVTLTTGRP